MTVNFTGQVLLIDKSPIGNTGDMWFYMDVMDPDGRNVSDMYKRMTIDKALYERLQLFDEKVLPKFIGKNCKLTAIVSERTDQKTGAIKHDGWKVIELVV